MLHNFSSQPEPLKIKSPLQYFSSYFNQDYFENVSHCSNLYYIRKTGSVLNTTLQEIRKLFGVLMLVGFILYPRMNMYWHTGMFLELIANQRDRFSLSLELYY